MTTYFSLQNFKSCFDLKIVPYIPTASRIKTLMRKMYCRIEWLFLPKNKTLKINQNRRDFIYEIFLGLRITRRFSLLALPVKFCNIVQPPLFFKGGEGEGWVNFDYLPQRGGIWKITNGGGSMVQGQVSWKEGRGLAVFLFNFFKVYRFYI